MDEGELDQQVSVLLDLFPEVGLDLLVQAVLHSEGSQETAIDFVIAHQGDSYDDDAKNSLGPNPNSDSLTNTPKYDENLSAKIAKLHNTLLKLEKEHLYPLGSVNLEENTANLSKERLSILQKQSAMRRGKRLHNKESNIPIDLVIEDSTSNTACLSTKMMDNKSLVDLKDESLRLLSRGMEIDIEDDPEELRRKAAEIHSSRVNLLRKAAAAYSDGGQMGGSIAQYYSSESHLLRKKLEEFNQKAAYITFFRRYYAHVWPLSLEIIDYQGIQLIFMD